MFYQITQQKTSRYRVRLQLSAVQLMANTFNFYSAPYICDAYNE